MHPLVIGVSYKNTPVELRERLAPAGDAQAALMRAATSLPGIGGALFIATCNRVEFVLAAESAFARAPRPLLQLWARHCQVSEASLALHAYVLEREHALRHLFKVTASLDSMVIGEPQILGQVKRAYKAAKDVDTVDVVLDACLQHAFRVAKRVRHETEIGTTHLSLAAVALDLAEQCAGPLSQQAVLLIGAGKMAGLAARHLRDRGAALTIANRTQQRADALATATEATPLAWERLHHGLVHCRCAIASVAAGAHTLTRQHLLAVMAERQHAPLLLIDLSVPRAIDPEIKNISHLSLYNVDDLESIAQENHHLRHQAGQRGLSIVAEEVGRFMEKRAQLRTYPTIIALRQHFNHIAELELQRYRAQHPQAAPEELLRVQGALRALVNKLLHHPQVNLKKAAGEESLCNHLQSLTTLFPLGGEATQEEEAATKAKKRSIG